MTKSRKQVADLDLNLIDEAASLLSLSNDPQFRDLARVLSRLRRTIRFNMANKRKRIECIEQLRRVRAYLALLSCDSELRWMKHGIVSDTLRNHDAEVAVATEFMQSRESQSIEFRSRCGTFARKLTELMDMLWKLGSDQS